MTTAVATLSGVLPGDTPPSILKLLLQKQHNWLR